MVDTRVVYFLWGRRSLWLLVPMLAPAALLAALSSARSLDLRWEDADLHLLLVSLIAACALAVAVCAALAGARSSHYGPIWLAAGCLAVGILMLTHGLLTPGVFDRPFSLWLGRAPYLAITAFTVALFLAGRRRQTATSRLAAHHPWLVLAVPFIGLGVPALIVSLSPLRLGGDQALPHEEAITWVVAGLDVVALAALAVVHWIRWRLGADPVQYSLVLAATMSMAAVLSLRLGELWRFSWWNYHGFLLAGFGGAVYAVLVRARRAGATANALAATFDRDPMTHIVKGYPEALKVLVRAVEVKDSYTHGHSERTAAIAVQLGQRVGLGADTLRAVARGAYLHDVGKIAIPLEILNKPGALSAEERAVIQTHPRVGCELVAQVVELAEALPVVLHHHERWDGTGYPARLGGADIPLVARVVAVADVWDALTSDRSYRPGMSPREALAHIVDGRGSHFEPRLVEAMISLAADWGYTPEPVAHVPGLIDAVTESCHEVTANHT